MSGHRIFRNFAALTGAQAVTMATSLVTVIVLARALGPEAYGVLGFGAAVLSYFGLATNFGMDAHGVREISRDPAQADRIVGIVLFARFALAALFFVVLLLGLGFVEMSARGRAVLIIQGIGLFFVAGNLEFAFQGLQRMGPMAARQIAAGLVVVFATLVLIDDPDDLLVAAAIPVAANLITATALYLYFRAGRDAGHNADDDASAAPTTLGDMAVFVRRAAPVALMGALITIHVNMDIIVLGFIRTEAEVGLYVAASRIFVLALMLANMLHSAFLPALSAAAGDEAAKLRAAGDYARVLCFLGCGIAVGGAVFAPAILALLFGEAFRDAAPALTILMLNAGLFHVAQAYGTPLLAWQSDKAYVKILGTGALANLGLNLILIPRYGIEGAAAATLVTQVLICGLLIVVAGRAFQLNHLPMAGKAALLAAACGAPLVAVLHLAAPPEVPAMIVGGAAFGAVYTTLAARLGLVDLRQLQRLLRGGGAAADTPPADGPK